MEKQMRLVSHLRRSSRRILPHSIGDQILHGNNDKGSVSGKSFDKHKPLRWDIASQRTVSDDFKAKVQVGMNPSSGKQTRSRWPNEAKFNQLLLQFLLDRSANVEVASTDGARGIIFDSRASYENGARQATLRYGFADACEQLKCRRKLRAVKLHSAASLSRIDTEEFRFFFVGLATGAARMALASNGAR